MTGASREEVRRRLRTRGPRPELTGEPRLSVVLPAFREPRIGDSVRRVREELAHLSGGVEVVVVDDGSGDDTAALARDAGADRVVELAVNQGKGGAVRAGVAAAGGRTIAFTDSDLAYAPAQIERLLLAVEDGWDVVIGDRSHPDTDTVVRPSALRVLGGRLVNGATRLALRGGHRDTQCGLKAFRGDVASILFEHLTIRGFAFDVEVIHIVERAGLSLEAVPVRVENSEVSTVNVVVDALRLVSDMRRIRLGGAGGRYDEVVADLRALTVPAAGGSVDPADDEAPGSPPPR